MAAAQRCGQRAAFPRSAIVFRSVNPSFDRSGFEALRQNGYRFLRGRPVYLFDPVGSRYLDRHNARMDRRLAWTVLQAPWRRAIRSLPT